MNEKLLQYIWQYQLFNRKQLSTTNGEPIVILDQGRINSYSGPDFLNARIKIGNTEWAGNVEIHIKSSNWRQHKHSDNHAYRNVILHVVYRHDLEKFHLPTLSLQDRISNLLIDKYELMMLAHHPIACHHFLPSVNDFEIELWKQRILAERIEHKTDRIKTRLIETKQDWHQVFYEQVAYNFGLTTNSTPFQEVAQRLPIRILAKYQNDLHKIESLLFGVAGFLSERFVDDYPNSLKKEFEFLSKKHNIKPIKKVNWNFGKLRPASFPSLRIAQFASLCFNSRSLFSKLMKTHNIKEIETLFQMIPSNYWENHYRFDKISERKVKVIGKSKIQNIIINTIIPFQFCYGQQKGNQKLKEKAIQLLNQIPKENHKITQTWEHLGVKHKTAFDSQALTHLFQNYCKPKKCLNCRIGLLALRDHPG